MPLIELVVIACLIADPGVCEERRYSFLDTDIRSCMARAQPFLADWRRRRPGWMIADWRCRVADDGERGA